ncbi:MAG: hypothetical protein HYT62_01025 [Candidatus Yanofskybacteria bacterium]|nr:hypothetical protein [Candidatus Yanofskybacteria bacterium]
MKIVILALLLLFLSLAPVFVFGQTIPSGTAVTPTDILLLFESLGGFLLMAGGVLIGITIIITGIMYMLAGSNQQKVTTAKNMLKAGVIGALVIFAAGIITETIRAIAGDPLKFFK